MNQTIEEKRVAVARDALAQVRCGSFHAEMGRYIFANARGCHGCALGAILCGAISVGQSFELPNKDRDDFDPVMEIARLTFNLWPYEELEEIEAYFSGFLFDGEQMKSLRIAFPDDRDRLIAILQNIIRNNGTFTPTDIRPIEPASASFDMKTMLPAPQPVAVTEGVGR